jgi:hypothetical protein
MSDLTLRISGEPDRTALRTLAERDSARVPAGRLLVADEGGRLLAAISLDTGAVIADPFVHTKDVVDLLQTRARQLNRRLRLAPRRRRRARGRAAPAET